MPSTIPPVTVRLSEDLRSQVDRLASMTKRSRSFLINEAVEQYVADRLVYLTDLDAAVDAIDTQPTHDGEAVFSWMKTWGQDEVKPAAEVFVSPDRNSR